MLMTVPLSTNLLVTEFRDLLVCKVLEHMLALSDNDNDDDDDYKPEK